MGPIYNLYAPETAEARAERLGDGGAAAAAPPVEPPKVMMKRGELVSTMRGLLWNKDGYVEHLKATYPAVEELIVFLSELPMLLEK